MFPTLKVQVLLQAPLPEVRGVLTHLLMIKAHSTELRHAAATTAQVKHQPLHQAEVRAVRMGIEVQVHLIQVEQV